MSIRRPELDTFMREELGLGTWMSLKEALGRPMPIAALIADIAAHDAQRAFLQVAQHACVIANAPGGPCGELARRLTIDLLAAYERSVNPTEGLVADFVRRQLSHRTIVHEHVIYLVQALALVYGAASGPAPSEAKVVFWLLAANDHIPRWEAEDRLLDTYEDSVAELWMVTRFNHGRHEKRDLVRGALLMRDPPERGPVRDRWERLQIDAFGMPFDRYVVELAGPMTMLSSTWGYPFETGPLRSPMLRPSDWCAYAPERRAFFDSRSWTRAEAAERLGAIRTPDGIPKRLGLFHEYPLLRVDDQLIASSPWPIRESLRLSVWGALRSAEERTAGSTSAWPPAAGDIVEGWCRRVVKEARPRLEESGITVIMSDTIGDASELEDVILTDGRRTLVFAVKASLAPHHVSKLECNKAAVLDWLTRFFFAKSTGNKRSGTHQRGGVLRQLDTKLRRIRGGALYPRVQREALLIPVVVTFEKFVDNLALYAWLRRTCAREHVLTQTDVAPVSVMTVAEFELTISLAAVGVDIFGALGRWKREEVHTSTERLLRNAGQGAAFQDLEFIETEHTDLRRRIERHMETLFPEPEPA